MNPQELLKIIQRTTDLNVNRHRMLLDGWDNLVLEVNDELIFRFTRREDILKQHIKELELLPLLNKHLTLQVPNPVCHQTETPPYYMAYRKIPGKPITRDLDEKNLETITQFLTELQSIDHAGLRKIPRYTPEAWKQEYHELYQRITREVYPSLETSIQAKITKEFNNFHETEFKFKPTLCHRDLTTDHILESGGEITGIIDWGDSCIGDQAFDLTGLVMGFGEKALKNVSRKLEYPPEYLERAWFYSHVSPFYEYLYGKEVQDEKRIKSGLEKINKTFS
jgi:aminoglycoside 2''-phosphotransferase